MRYQIHAVYDDSDICIWSTDPSQIGVKTYKTGYILIRRQYKTEAAAQMAIDRKYRREFPKHALISIEPMATVAQSADAPSLY